MIKTQPRLVVALDVPAFEDAAALVRTLAPLGVIFKVGFEPLFAYGDAILALLAREHAGYFLDVKLHDIPRTVGAAVRQAVRPGMRIVNVHALGGLEMMAAAVENAATRAAEIGCEPPLVLAVTLLTSLDQAAMHQLGIAGSVEDAVLALASLAKRAGCGGVVIGAHEVVTMKAALGDEFRALCPGIRPAGSAAGDQRRVATPAAAVAAGADYLVVGRPIVEADDPPAAVRGLLAEMRSA
jgi:orotidine-5'-phosphate decarboxylase